MEKVEYKTNLNASTEKIWNILWNDETYRKWTSVFSEGSFMESDWKVGGRTLFLDGKGNGMVSTIDAIEPNKLISFKHLGMIKDGVEDFDSEDVKKWSGSHENYKLKSHGDETELLVELDLDDEYKDYFGDTWTKAFEIIKSLVEE